MTPRFGMSPQSGKRYRRRPGAYAVLLRDDRILLTFQNAPEPEFQLPGGGVDPGEGPVTALHREVMEETGWRISSPQRVCAYRRFCFMPEYGFHAEKFCSIWLARPVARLGPPSEAGHTAHWVDIYDAVALIADPGARHGLARALR